jgi:tetratricopeptide (TPR) repeat protein
LLIFGGLVIVAAVLLILLVVWLRRSDSSGLQPGETSARSVSPVERLQAVEEEAKHFVELGQIVQARETWLKFKGQYPAVESDRVNSRIRQLEARLPLSERDVLAERRRQAGFDYLSKQDLAMAAAYLRSAAALSPDIANSAITTSTLQNLLQRSKLANAPGAGDVAAARASFESAEQALKAGAVNAETNERLIMAVEADYAEPAYWVGLGDFFMRQELVDDARVMYNEALDHVSDPRQKSEITAKIRAISK